MGHERGENSRQDECQFHQGKACEEKQKQKLFLPVVRRSHACGGRLNQKKRGKHTEENKMQKSDDNRMFFEKFLEGPAKEHREHKQGFEEKQKHHKSDHAIQET